MRSLGDNLRLQRVALVGPGKLLGRVMSEELPELKSIQELLFELPLYAEYRAPIGIVRQIYSRAEAAKFDAFCPFCKKQSTFEFSGAYVQDGQWSVISQFTSFGSVSVECARSKHHTIKFWFLLRHLKIQKVGQYPSLADIANDEVAVFRSAMDKVDGQEFHKAIGLAAHGVGVGSFVYLRRVFERLIYKRFEEFKDAEKWSEEEFAKLRMSEKIAFLKGHLPDFLVEHSEIYSILSIGIHELDEKECLAHFEVIKASIIMILEEDKRKQEELARRDQISKALKNIASPKKKAEEAEG